jgi:DNA-binding NarL/FixJ family response regulator
MRVLLADNRVEVRSALRFLLEQEPGISVVGEAAEAGALFAQAEAIQPDLVLLDWDLPGARAADLLPMLLTCCPYAKVIVLSGRPEARQEALTAEIFAFVSKGDPPEWLLRTLQAVERGGENKLE